MCSSNTTYIIPDCQVVEALNRLRSFWPNQSRGRRGHGIDFVLFWPGQWPQIRTDKRRRSQRMKDEGASGRSYLLTITPSIYRYFPNRIMSPSNSRQPCGDLSSFPPLSMFHSPQEQFYLLAPFRILTPLAPPYIQLYSASLELERETCAHRFT